jgi:hypothetical protein
MIMTGRDDLRRAEAFLRSRACFHRFDFAITRRHGGYKRIEQMLRGVSDIIDGAIESCLVCFGGFRETAQLADELKGRRANLVVGRGRTEVMKCFDGSAHVRSINASRLTINYQTVNRVDQHNLFGNADVFGLCKKAQRFFTPFAADAALFHSAERDA